MVSTQRQTNIELLRILAILLISMMHGIRCAYGSTSALNFTAFVAVNAVGNMGVTLFVLISGYFGIRMRLSKLFTLWTTVLFYSLLIFVLTHFVLGGPADAKTLLKDAYVALTPVTSGTWWFITSYIILMLLSPLLNRGCELMSQRQFVYLLAVLGAVYILSPTLLMHSLSNTPGGKSTENMILVYLVGRYVARFPVPAWLGRRPLVVFGLCAVIIFAVDRFLLDPLFMAKDHHLLVFLGALSLFLWFRGVTIGGRCLGIVVLWAAGFVFPVYLLNWFLMEQFEPFYLDYRDAPLFLPRYLCVQLLIVMVSVVIEMARRLLLGNVQSWLARKCDEKMPNMSSFL